MNYPINQIFQSIQGEGYFSGKPSIFIRFQGCPIRCSWCNAKYTWDKNLGDKRDLNFIFKKYTSRKWAELKSKNILDSFKKEKYTATHVVITGGEPCIYDLRDLIHILEKESYRCQLETSGTHKIFCSEKTWITLSPKVRVRGEFYFLDHTLNQAHELKYPVGREKDIDELNRLLNKSNFKNPSLKISLQPINQSVRATKICIKACIKNNWDLSIQIQKYLNIL